MVETMEKAMPWPETPFQRNVREMNRAFQTLSKSLRGKSEKALERWASRFEKQKELLDFAKVYFSETSPEKRKALLSGTVTQATGLKGEIADRLGADLSQIWELSSKNLTQGLTSEEEKELNLLIWNFPLEEGFKRVATNLAFASVGEARAKPGRLIGRRAPAETLSPKLGGPEEGEEKREEKPRSEAEIAAQEGAVERASQEGEVPFRKPPGEPPDKEEGKLNKFRGKAREFGGKAKKKLRGKAREFGGKAVDWASGWWPYASGGVVVVFLLWRLGIAARRPGGGLIEAGDRRFLPPEQQKAVKIEDRIKEEMPEKKRLPSGMGETYLKDRERIRKYFFDETEIEGYRMTDLVKSLRKMSDVRRFVYLEALKDEVGDRTKSEVKEELEKSDYSAEEIEQFWELSQKGGLEDLDEFIEEYFIEKYGK